MSDLSEEQAQALSEAMRDVPVPPTWDLSILSHLGEALRADRLEHAVSEVDYPVQGPQLV